MFDIAGKKIWVAGHNGLVGGALMRRLEKERCELLTVERKDLDLRRQQEVEQWLEAHRPDAVFVAAATVGGIHANESRPAEFIYDNMAIETNIIHAAKVLGVRKLLFLGSACIYPRQLPQPITEDRLLTGPLEPTNQWYAVAKIAGVKLCEAYRQQYGCDFICAMPTNLYGIHDNFNDRMAHVIPALTRRIHEAKLQNLPQVEVWGTGTPRREFLYSEDLADGLVFLMSHYSGAAPVNIGYGEDISIAELAKLIAEIVGYHGSITFDRSKPDGVMQRVLDTSVMRKLGWQAQTPLREGLQKTYEWFYSKGPEKLRGYSA